MHEASGIAAGSERIGGIVEKVTFFNAENGFAVLKVSIKGEREPSTVVGYVAAVNPGEHIEAAGAWQNDKTWGMQFKSERLTVIPPDTLEGISKYLSSGMVRGIGPHFAEVLIRAFGQDVFTVIEEQPERLLELPGIGRKRMEQVVSAWAEQRAVRKIMVFLQSHGVGTARAVRIYRAYGEDAISVVSTNPYRLTLDIPGIGFRTADQIARNLGIPSDSPLRARAAVGHVLLELSSAGHCRIPRQMLVESCDSLLDIPAPVIEEALKLELSIGNVVAAGEESDRCYYLNELYRAEKGVAVHIRRLMQGMLPWKVNDPCRAIELAERQSGIELSHSQRNALALALESKLIVITGGPGVGKTTIVKTLLGILGQDGRKFVLCAPTGRASKRLAEATGMEAKTIHRVLEFDPHLSDFRRGPSNPLQADVVVVDESSMIDVVLMNRLLGAVPDHAAVMFAGDVDQLPPVGPGFVLADMIRSGFVPVVRLTEIFRQAQSSMIIVNAHRINRGEHVLKPSGEGLSDFYVVDAKGAENIQRRLLQVVCDRIPARFGLDPVRDIQVLTPMNKGVLGTKSLNTLLQETLNPGMRKKLVRFGTAFSEGDKIIQIVNNYDREVFNGDIGRIASVDEEEGRLCVQFDDREVVYEAGDIDEIALAYAITIHKSQGSEYPAVVIPLSMQHYTLLERNLIYTAVTRAKKLVMIIGDPRALAIAIAEKRASGRLTGLAPMISGESVRSLLQG
ncbi:MAG: ATP-dependent RecD-like DNA helicase [Chlorobiaceae bacterium]|nr:ATP-dependent RecD-like DNA helicase [Chlorobiaceae bacterium]NTV60046.1 ATP-dependent RecD-like DNA helicase [Chlorobiaceae bacterium]